MKESSVTTPRLTIRGIDKHLDHDSGNEASSGSELWCTTNISPYSPHTTMAKVDAEAEYAPSQSKMEAAGLGNEEKGDEEQSREEASGSDSEEEEAS